MSKHQLNELVKAMKKNGAAASSRAIVERSALKAIENRWDLDDKSKKRGTDREWERISRDALSFQTEHNRLRREFDATVKEMANPHKPASAEVEMLRAAAWRRLERVLESSKDLVKFPVAMKALEQAAADGDVHMIDAARRELGPWLATVANEKLPGEVAAWLDINSSSVLAADARLVMMDAEETLQRADMAVAAYAHGATTRNWPSVIVGMEPGEVVHTDPDYDPSQR